MSNLSNPNLDIWGAALHETRDCFYCGEVYTGASSSAPEDFRTTYCSLECYEADTNKMKETQTKEEVPNATQESSDFDFENPNYTTSKIGDFIIKVPKANSK